jgi:hypothetical protein
MSPAVYNISIEAGTTYRRRVLFFQDEARAIPQDLTGCAVAAWIGRAAAKLQIDATIQDAAGGIVQLELSPSATRSVQPGTYAWDMLLRAPSGDVIKHIEGEATIGDTVTPQV